MRNIGLVSAAVIAMSMAAMAGTVAASAPPVMQNRVCTLGAGGQEQWMAIELEQARLEIVGAVASAQAEGLSGEAAQQRIKWIIQADYIQELTACQDVFPNEGGLPMQVLGFLALSRAHRSLINDNQLRRGSDGDLAVSALLADSMVRPQGSRHWTDRSRGGSRGGFGGGTRGGSGGSWTAGDAGRNVPGNAAAGQPATDAGTTEIQQTQTTNDPDLDDEAGEPD